MNQTAPEIPCERVLDPSLQDFTAFTDSADSQAFRKRFPTSRIYQMRFQGSDKPGSGCIALLDAGEENSKAFLCTKAGIYSIKVKPSN